MIEARPIDLTTDDLVAAWRLLLLRAERNNSTGCLEVSDGLSHGYPVVCINGEKWLGHRVSCYLAYGSPQIGKPYSLHSCDNKGCVEPTHLRWGSQAENMLDNSERGPKRETCARGHRFDRVNARQRVCSVCASKRNAEYRERIRAALIASGVSLDARKKPMGAEAAEQIRAWCSYGFSQVQIGTWFDVSQASVSSIIRRRTYK